MREHREYDEDELWDSEKLLTLDELLDDSKDEQGDADRPTLSEKERDELLEEIHAELLTDDERNDFLKEASIRHEAFPFTLEKYEELLTCYPQIRMYSSFEKDDHHARAYYAIKDILRSGELSHLSARAQWKALSDRFSVEWSTIKPWFTQYKYPRNIHRLGTLELSRLRTK